MFTYSLARAFCTEAGSLFRSIYGLPVPEEGGGGGGSDKFFDNHQKNMKEKAIKYKSPFKIVKFGVYFSLGSSQTCGLGVLFVKH